MSNNPELRNQVYLDFKRQWRIAFATALFCTISILVVLVGKTGLYWVLYATLGGWLNGLSIYRMWYLNKILSMLEK